MQCSSRVRRCARAVRATPHAWTLRFNNDLQIRLIDRSATGDEQAAGAAHDDIASHARCAHGAGPGFRIACGKLYSAGRNFVGWPAVRTGSAVQAILDRLGGNEAQLRLGRDRRGLAGRRVAAFASSLSQDLELAEAADRDFLTLGGSVRDRSESGVDGLLALGLAHSQR